MQTLFDRLGELVAGAQCPGCARPKLGLCEDCEQELCRAQPFQQQLVGVPVVAASSYTGIWRETLLVAKERHGLGLLAIQSKLLSRALHELCVTEKLQQLCLVPVPTARSRIAERGIDYPLELARRAGRLLRLRGVSVLVCPRLRLTRVPADQAKLSESTRALNVQHSMAWRGSPPDFPVVVVDDLVTTGATLAEAIRACGQRSIWVRGAACLARPLEKSAAAVCANTTTLRID